MIKVQIRRGTDGVAEFRVNGHAGYADRGYDVVCAAVSAIVQTALFGLDRVAGQPFESEVKEGNVWCRLDPGAPESHAKAQAILETMILGLKDIAEGMPKFVRFTEGG